MRKKNLAEKNVRELTIGRVVCKNSRLIAAADE